MSRAGRNVREIYTNEEPKEFFGRKEIAVEKLFEILEDRIRVVLQNRRSINKKRLELQESVS